MSQLLIYIEFVIKVILEIEIVVTDNDDMIHPINYLTKKNLLTDI